MNHYGTKALEHWRRHAPHRLEEIQDQETFFTELGEQIATQIVELTIQIETGRFAPLAMAGSSRENGRYLQEVSRRITARRIAEEVVMDELVWMQDPSLSIDEAREEWEQTRPADSNLVSWAERIQDSPDLAPPTAELEEKAKDWALPVWFLEGLIAAEIPGQYAQEHEKVLTEAASVRFLREVH
ncbi:MULTISPECIES: hypothetical protein [Actinomycetes]|uniref:Uncharacterized protein n=6 Tax=Actinomycetes TaxID=1760 RepID=A0A3T0DGP4_BREAU|nr:MULTISPECIES: hypothetical protein [Actinomycetes]MDN5586410.1 hypothetical protein [Brevibacterium sp.]MDN6332902.1 hypothetical protein [Micrococcaceae bacterium]MDN6400134.1 hypothetical protein [Brachybacterium sp.]AHI20916.1 hypothetical protein CCASEI_11830 [Corynebacterium casei LMG S-19264]AZT94303.1 hypothetical protein CXR23_15065 [Brevibacterium aurantiacum]